MTGAWPRHPSVRFAGIQTDSATITVIRQEILEGFFVLHVIQDWGS